MTEPTLGAIYRGEGRCEFRVWAPAAQRVEVVFPGGRPSVLLEREADGTHAGRLDNAVPGERYLFRLDGSTERPDPASRAQPDGVHGPSEIVDPAFAWEDGSWSGLPLQDFVIYELHVGTFTPEGTFDAAIGKLEHLKSIGVTAVEIMPVAQFPGNRNWGYDGVFPFAVQQSYGGPSALKRFVNACHRAGMAAILDVVYNHLGPEGNYLSDFGPYFTDRYKTPWGLSINFDGPDNEGVRRFFIENAKMWLTEFHFDALRADAIHAIYDFSAQPFLEELCAEIHALGKAQNRQVFAIAESDLNDARVIRSRELGGFGFDSQWSDDFHHVLHALLTDDRSGYYEDFGTLSQLKKALTVGYIYTGDYSRHRRRRHGNSPQILDARKFVVFSQNHDQIGNRMKGERLADIVDPPRLRLAAMAVLLSPFVPMLFMGEEYGERAPFLYFISHTDAPLVEAVRSGRREEFAAFKWAGEPPDPQSEETFRQSKLRWSLLDEAPHRAMADFYRALLRLRRETPALRHLSKEYLEVAVDEEKGIATWKRWFGRSEAFVALNVKAGAAVCAVPAGHWRRALDSEDRRFGGAGGSAPETLYSDGDATLAVGGHAGLVYTRQRES